MKGTKSMKIYEIYDYEEALSIGTLLYYEKEKTFLIELQDNLNECNAPLAFTGLVKKGIFSVPRDLSLMWVAERIIPSGRQNIGSILATHRLKKYDDMKFLELSEGRCSQDSLCIKKLESMPKYVEKRMLTGLTDCVALEDKSLLCFFRDESVKKVILNKLTSEEGVGKVLSNEMLYNSCTLGTDGFYISFGNTIDIPAWLLYKKGQKIPLNYRDFLSFVSRNVIDTSESCSLLECSRQNLAYMVSQKQLDPLKENVKGNLYLKKDILSKKW